MRQAITASLDCTIKFWDTFNGENKGIINTLSKIYDMHISRDEVSLVTGHNDRSIKVWDTKTKELQFTIDEAHGDPVSCVRFTPDEVSIVTTSKDDCIKVWDIRKRQI
jgi:WD40 repeat protein